MNVLGIPDHLHAALDMLGVRMPDKTKQVKRGTPVSTVDPRWKRGEDPPF